MLSFFRAARYWAGVISLPAGPVLSLAGAIFTNGASHHLHVGCEILAALADADPHETLAVVDEEVFEVPAVAFVLDGLHVRVPLLMKTLYVETSYKSNHEMLQET